MPGKCGCSTGQRARRRVGPVVMTLADIAASYGVPLRTLLGMSVRTWDLTARVARWLRWREVRQVAAAIGLTCAALRARMRRNGLTLDEAVVWYR